MSFFTYILTILWITIKRIVKNWRQVAALLAGLVLAAGIMAAVPIYSSASLQKSFIREWVQEDPVRPPFSLILAHDNDRRRYPVRPSHLERLSERVRTELPRVVGMEPTTSTAYARIGPDPLLADPDGEPDLLSPQGELAFLSNLREAGEIVMGRWYEPRSDGPVEAVVDESTFRNLELVLDTDYHYHYSAYPSEPAYTGTDDVRLTVRVVGVVRAAQGTTTAEWIYPPPFQRRLFIHPDEFERRLLGDLALRVEDYDHFAVFPFADVSVEEIDRLRAGLVEFESRASRIPGETGFWRSPIEFFEDFGARADAIALFLLALAVPTLGMVLYYVILMAGVTVDSRRTEITVLQSRGGGRVQVMASFVIEWLLLGLVAVAVGPLVGVLLSRMMGSTTGFMTFVNRGALPTGIGPSAFGYSIAAALVAVVAASGPVVSTFRHSIVTLRAEQARGSSRSAWHRYYIDLILIALAVFGYQSLSWEEVALAPGNPLEADPVLFFVPVVFLLGTGLLLLRLWPLVMSLLARSTAKLRGVVTQLVFRRLHRNSVQYVPILLLLIVTVALAVYTAAAGRTLARNFEDQIYYRVGADAVIDEQWVPPDDGLELGTGPPPDDPPDDPGALAPPGGVVAEPPLRARAEIDGVESVARVLRGRGRLTDGSRNLGNADFMAIEPYEFARTAWYRDDLFDAHFYDYLRMLGDHRGGAIINRELAEDGQLSLGSLLEVRYDGEIFDIYVVAVVDFWPGFEDPSDDFFIANLGYIQDQTRITPYAGWYRLTREADLQAIVEELSHSSIYASTVVDGRSELVRLRREPYRMGFYGILSMGFLASVLVTVLGVFIYTFYSVRGRLVQFGALRANGLSLRQLVGIVGFEQLVTLGSGLGIGYGPGRVATTTFVPFFRDRAGGLSRVPPFLIVTELSDIYLTFGVVSAVFVIVVLGLSIFLVRRQLFSSLKLGEEAQ
ncbi:MAG: FtsX-like permease family protein [Spirochaetota bacterium]